MQGVLSGWRCIRHVGLAVQADQAFVLHGGQLEIAAGEAVLDLEGLVTPCGDFQTVVDCFVAGSIYSIVEVDVL